jgi:two-component system NtrC family sensor kinase
MSNPSQPQIILIINKDTQTNFLMERIIKANGHTVEVATSIQNAKQFLAPFPPAIIIIEESIAKENLFSWVEELRIQHPILPILLYTPQEDPATLKIALRLGINDYLSPPLTRDEIVHAVESNIKKTQLLKNYVLLESRRATQQLQARVNELEIMTRLGRLVTSTLNLDDVLKHIVDAAVELTGSEEGSLLLLDEKTGELYMRASRNFNEDFVSTFRLPIQDSLAGMVLRTGEAVVLDDSTPQKIKTSYLVQSLVYVPLILKGQVFGVLGVDNRHSRKNFKQNDVLMLSTLAEFAVIAIENARLFTETTNEQNKLQTIISRIEDGVMVLDQDNRILLINRSAIHTFEFEENVPLGTPIQNILTDIELLSIILRGEENLTNRTEINTSDEHTYSAQVTPIPGVGLAVTLHDISYLKKLDRIKSDFVSTVSHDLRSPLTAILGYTELIERAGTINDLQKEFVKRVQTSVHNITSLVDDLLNLGRIEAGFDTRKELVDLEYFIEHSVDNLYAELQVRNQNIKVELPDDLPQIFGSPVQIRQLLENLLGNAIKYSPNNSQIFVRLRVEQKQIIMQIQDQGVGIPSVDLPYIFDKFYRSGNISTEIPGTGLGLAIVKSIVENHQGRIWVDSIMGEGSTFTIVFPISE